ncbi:MAG: protease HtpX [Gammaproteobacteria bacterium]|nr:protease HtpX [Gammaproteobacteria bacterium]
MMRIALFLATNLAVVLIASVTLSLLGVGNYLSSKGLDLRQLLIFCFVFGMAGSLVSLFLSKTMAKWSMGVQLVQDVRDPEARWLVDTVAELARDAGIAMPEVGVFDSPQSNAFATGWNKNAALVAVSSGLLRRFRRDELRAVLGHEIAHVANGDMVTLALIQGVVNTFVMFFARIIGYAIDSFFRRDSEEGGHVGIGFYLGSFVAEIVLGILASAIVAGFSRWREFRADAGGARLAGSMSMIGALQRLKAESEMPDQMPAQFQAFAITSGRLQGLAKFFMSHPPLDERIEALRRAA